MADLLNKKIAAINVSRAAANALDIVEKSERKGRIRRVVRRRKVFIEIRNGSFMSGPSILPQPRATEFRRDNLRLGDLYIVPGDWSGSSCNGPGSNLTRIVELGESTFSYLTASGRTEHSERYEDAKGVVVRVTEGELEIVSGSAHLNNLSGVDATLSGADPTTEQISRLAYNKRFST